MKLWKFDTKVQYLKYKVLKEMSRQAWAGTLNENIMNISKIIIPGKKASMRCCVYKERAVLDQRVGVALCNTKNAKNIIEIVDIACDDCPAAGYFVTSVCRGCLGRKCKSACKRNAIYFDDNFFAHIDKEACINCGLCAKACPFNAIQNFVRPCYSACEVKAISFNNEEKVVEIDKEKCNNCGSCIFNCPFGALTDKTDILNVIDIFKNSDGNKKYKIHAIIAPSISSQFSYGTFGQLITALKKLGFYDVIETAAGADIVALDEAKELAEKGMLISSCCPSFVSYIEKNFPELVQYVSHNPSPMVKISEIVKKQDPEGKVIFISPCPSKKIEAQKDGNKNFIDSVITYEELQALLDSKDINLNELEETELNTASYFGHIFGRTGGLSEAVVEALKEQNIYFEVKPVICSGIKECKEALTQLKNGTFKGNFIEGMYCVDGCINGSACLTHGLINKVKLNKHASESIGKKMTKFKKINS